MGNTDKFEMIANIYDTSERIQIAKVSSDAIREYLVDANSKHAIDFGSLNVYPDLRVIPITHIEHEHSALLSPKQCNIFL
ncbi:hypothetical protein [Paenibacillus thiaminolyticus]|uniref:hypothetical protein n=1 Tax=Paenibacillus thiaminolyticus TaxID=49283 RepID=UPI0021760FF8|nr:hypothetical protein [Paenibacillus thiaminolyticus]